MLSLLLAAVPLPQGPGPSLAPVVINEFCYDDSGTDDKEFVELYNRSGAPVDISGWTLAGSDPSGTNGVVTIPANTILPAGGYWVVAGSTSTVPNTNQSAAVSPNNLWENDNESIDLVDLAANVVDSVAWETGRGSWGPHPREGSGIWGEITTVDAFPQTWQRRVDGYDSDDNGCDFCVMAWTPGAGNGSAQNLLPGYRNDFDDPAGTSYTNDFNYAFVAPRTADPASITNATASTIAIPPSPQGGNVCIWQDPTGGGNASYMRIGASEQFLLETYVWVIGGNAAFAAPGATGEGESWAIGVSGTTDGGAHPADINGYHAAILCTGMRPGGTGIAWVAYVQQGQTNIYLVDLNNGGPGPVILAGPIVATPGVNDGWQRLRLRIDGGNLVANYGGTYGCDDGQRFTASGYTNCGGTVYFQYRECIGTNALMTPLITDRLEVYGITPFSVTPGGAPSPTNFGTPAQTTSGGDPVIGNSAFGYAISGMVPNGVGALIVGIGALGPGSSVLGAPPAVQIYVTPVTQVLLFPDALGNTGFAIALPCDNSFTGLPLTTQVLDLDLTLPYAVPIGTSAGLEVVVGN